MLTCKFCNKECKNNNSVAQHEIRCIKNDNRILSHLKPKSEKFYEAMQNKTQTYANQYTKAKDLGLPKPELSKESKEKLSKASTGKLHSEETKKQISISMKAVVLANPEKFMQPNRGKVKNIIYNGITLKGTWELLTAKYLDKANIVWERPSIGFEYIFNGNSHMYYPDFYIPEINTYLEVKGYKTDKDDAKWNCFKSTLIVIDKDAISAIKKGTFKLLLNFKSTIEPIIISNDEYKLYTNKFDGRFTCSKCNTIISRGDIKYCVECRKTIVKPAPPGGFTCSKCNAIVSRSRIKYCKACLPEGRKLARIPGDKDIFLKTQELRITAVKNSSINFKVNGWIDKLRKILELYPDGNGLASCKVRVWLKKYLPEIEKRAWHKK